MKYILIVLINIGLSHGVWSQVSLQENSKYRSSRQSDSLNLIAFNQQALGDLWKVKWDFNLPLDEWFGVSLNPAGRVYCLDLDGDPNCSADRYGGNHLHGELTDLQLPFLEHLFLSSNNISGEIPNFSGMPHLLTLQLSANAFTGNIPDFSNLEKLIKLDLEYNQLAGQVPDFEKLPNLQSIYYGHNQLVGDLPNFDNSRHLKQLYAGNNALKFDIHEIGDFDQLQQLILNDNLIYGDVTAIPLWDNLQTLVLLNNKLTGCITQETFAQLKRYDLKGNAIQTCSSYDYFIADAFSPNGDGMNDYFEFFFDPTLNIPETVTVSIWSDKRELVYENSDYQGDWDGREKRYGKLVEEGMYYYQVVLDGSERIDGWVYIKY